MTVPGLSNIVRFPEREGNSQFHPAAIEDLNRPPMRLWFIPHSRCYSVARLIWKKRMGGQPRPPSNVGPWKARAGRAGTSAGGVVLNIGSPIRKSGSQPVVPVRLQGDQD